MELVRLEYNQKQGLFHFEDVDKENKNTNGWKTICEKMSVDQAMEFVEDIGDDIKIPFKTMVKNFEIFLKTSPN